MDIEKFILLILLYLLLLVVPGCIKKEADLISPTCVSGCTTLQGQLTTGQGAAPIGDASLTLNWVNTVYLSGGTIRKKAVTKTDANGRYKLTFQVRDDELEEGYFDVEISANPKKYLHCGGIPHSFTFFEIERDTTIEVNYFIPQIAFMEIMVSNPEQVTDQDYFGSTVYSPFGVDGKQGCGNVLFWGSGYPEKKLVEVAAEQPVVVDTRKRKGRDGVTTVTKDTLRLGVGQKMAYTVQF